MTPARMIDSPIRCMLARAASGPPRLFSAVVPVGIDATIIGATLIVHTHIVLMADTESAAARLPVLVTIMTSIVLGLIGFTLHAGIVIMLDMATAQSRQARRYLELCGLCYWPQLLYSIPALAATWWWFDPPALEYLDSDADFMAVADDYGAEVARMPFSVIMETARQFALIWLLALHACTLRVVSGMSVGGTWGAGVVLAAVFLGVPWLAGRFAELLFF